MFYIENIKQNVVHRFLGNLILFIIIPTSKMTNEHERMGGGKKGRNILDKCPQHNKQSICI